MEKLFDDVKGVIIFYVIIAVLAIIFTIRMDELNSQANEDNSINETYYA